jgi:CheY-like chemotaxis protein
LDFVSSEGVGTEFWIDLPLCSEWNQSLLSNKPLDGHDLPAQLQLKRPKKILYIEDNPSNIRLLRQVFARYPLINLDVAEEAFLGIYKARSLQPDLIILDINLPGMDGYETLSVLKHDSITNNIPVVGLSANAMPYDIDRGRKSGFYEYLTKPLDINLLIHVLNEVFVET